MRAGRRVRIAAASLVAGGLLAGCSHGVRHPGPPPPPIVPVANGRCRSTAVPAAGALAVDQTCDAAAGPAGPELTFTDVAFDDDTHGWAVGTACPAGSSAGSSAGCEGVVEATVDGGAGWTIQYVGNVTLTHLDVVDDFHVWVIATLAGCASGGRCEDSLLRTSDGGATWATVLRTAVDLRDVHFATADAGWLAEADCSPALPPGPGARCPGGILGTTDGGTHWNPVLHTPGPVIALSSAGETAWAVEATPSSSASSAALDVMVSQPGGRWGERGSVPLRSGFDPGTVAAISLFDPTAGWLSVFQMSSCAMHGCAVATLYRTGDGGRTWDEAPLPGREQCGGFQPTLALAPGGGVYASQGVSLATCDPPAAALFTWDSSGWDRLHSWTLTQASSMAWPDATDGWVVEGGAVAHSTDRGATWVQQLPAPRPTASLVFTDARHGWGAQTISDAGAVLRTDDGGRTWAVVARFSGIVDHVAAHDQEAWAVVVSEPANGSSIVGTVDDGRTWSTLSATSASVDALSMFGPAGVLVTSPVDGALDQPSHLAPVSFSVTSDGGRTWHLTGVVSGSDTDLLGGASFADPSDGWAVIGDRLSVTHDSGKSWAGLGSLPAGFGTAGIELLTPTTGWVWSTYQTAALPRVALLATHDAGRTWVRDNLAPTMTPTGMGGTALGAWFADPDQGWLMAGAAIWETADGGVTWSPRTPPPPNGRSGKPHTVG